MTTFLSLRFRRFLASCVKRHLSLHLEKVLFLLFALFGWLGAFGQSATEYFSVGNPIDYCGTDYYLVWSSHPQENYYLQEYLPKGESLDHYNQMFTVSVLFLDRTPLEAVTAKVAELEERKKTDPVTNYSVAKNGDEYILEFIVSDTKNDEIHTVEVDIHYYKQMTINGKKASVLSFYSGRAYEDDIIPFIKSIPEKRNAWYEGMTKLNPSPKFPKK